MKGFSNEQLSAAYYLKIPSPIFDIVLGNVPGDPFNSSASLLTHKPPFKKR